MSLTFEETISLMIKDKEELSLDNIDNLVSKMIEETPTRYLPRASEIVDNQEFILMLSDLLKNPDREKKEELLNYLLESTKLFYYHKLRDMYDEMARDTAENRKHQRLDALDQEYNANYGGR